MNYSIIRYILGIVLKVEAVFMLLPVVVALIYHENPVYFLITIVLCLAVGQLLSHKRPANTVFYAAEGFVTVSLSWIIISIFGALPFWMSREIPSYVNALFETISGFTTTGASILDDIEAMSRCNLFWRSLTHWLGGMGVLVFVMAIFPMGSGNQLYLMQAESTGPDVEKLAPRMRTTATILYAIYGGLTVLEILLLFVTGMPLFDSFAIAFGSAGTGGFGVLNDSMASYAPHLQVIVTVFIILFGVNFNIYFLILRKKFKNALSSTELRVYLCIIVASGLLIAYNIRHIFTTIPGAIQQAFFQVASIMTTTGFVTADFDLWPQFSKTILLLLMFIGACAGSTGGGIKVSRVILLGKSVNRRMFVLRHPHSKRKIKMNGNVVDDSIVQNTNIYITAYLLIFAVSLLLISVDEMDLTSHFSAVTATINNIGPGFANVGATCNYNGYSGFSKFVLMFDMLVGRLEIFPLLALIDPRTWRKR